MAWSGGKGMQDTLSLALGLFGDGCAKKGETVTEHFPGFFVRANVAGGLAFVRTIPSW